VNCAAIPECLLESELFGHVKGAFTDAIATRPGRFENADQGTIFLDEIGDMTPKLQVKVLRVIQERKFEPLGSSKTHEVDIRILAATHQDLQRLVAEGRFREDLFYRLNVIPIHLPPLRERRSDIPVFIEHFLKSFNQETGKNVEGFSKDAIRVFKKYRWPGNIRELENLVERAVVLKGDPAPEGRSHREGNSPQQPAGAAKAGGLIGVEDLPSPLNGVDFPDLFGDVALPEEGVDLRDVIQNLEIQFIQKAVERSLGNKNKAARLLKINRTTLIEKIRKFNDQARSRRPRRNRGGGAGMVGDGSRKSWKT
jgi:transcriptional regulator with GAF, ATPase, and Fis domain